MSKNSAPLTYAAAGLSDIGRIRSSNQDSIYCSLEKNFYIVADGMGGHKGGDIASQMAVKLISDHFLSKQFNTEEEVKHHLAQAIEQAGQKIFEHSCKEPLLKGMGTTVVALYFFDGRAYMANVGDSRAYLINQNSLFQMTKDHSLIQEKINMGLYGREEAKRDRMKNVLVRSVGFENTTQVDIFSYKVSRGDYFILCSDGLHGKVSNKLLMNIFSERLFKNAPAKTSEELKEVAQILVNAANNNGGQDNISVILAQAK